MDFSILTNKFVRLLDLKLCPSSQARWQTLIMNKRSSMVRSFSGTVYRGRTREIEWQQRTNFWPPDKTEEFDKYPMVTADQLRGRTTRPRRVKMLMRDFIEDALYNPS